MKPLTDSPLIEPLTEREEDVLALLVEGKTNREIAEELVLSVNTVKWYNREIYGKLGVENREEAAEQGIEMGLVEAEQQDGRPNYHLPRPATSLLGREKEVEELEGLLLDDNTRIISLIGPGGMGKTRLAIELALKLTRRFKNGVAFVPLAPLQTEDSIIPAIAQSLRFTFHGGTQDEKTQLVNFLRGKELLLVLDNFEHLIGSAPLLAEMIAAAPNLKMVVTSREKLKLQIEQLYLLQSLPLLDWETVEKAEQDPAVQLFLEYGHRVRPTFELQPEDLEALHQILQLVDGMPLAIILASAWLELLKPEEIAAELQKNIGFLEADYQDLPGRQQSMRVVFDTSWNRLNEKEQKVFSGLSVFQGGFTLDAARKVVDATPDILLVLVSRSLLNRDEDGRFEIHELLRQFAAEKLTHSPTYEAAVRDNHSDYYLSLLEGAESELKGANSENTFELIKIDIDNIYEAWNRAVKEKHFLQLGSAAFSLSYYSSLSGRYKQTLAAFDQATSRIKQYLAQVADPDPAIIAVQIRLYAYRCAPHISRGDVSRAVAFGNEALSLLERPELKSFDVRYEKAVSLSVLGFTYTLYDRYDEARKLLAESLSLFEQLEDAWQIANTNWRLGEIGIRFADFEEAERCARKAIQLFKELGDRRSLTRAQNMLGFSLCTLGEWEEGEALMRSSLAIFREMGEDTMAVKTLTSLSEVVHFKGDFQEAQALATKGMAEHRRLGQKTWLIGDKNHWGWAALHLGDYEVVLDVVQSILQYAQDNNLKMRSGRGHSLSGDAWLARQQLNKALEHLKDSAVILREIGVNDYLCFTLGSLCCANIKSGDTSEAEKVIPEALDFGLGQKSTLYLAAVLPTLSLLKAEQGEAEKAVELYALAGREPYVANSQWYEDVFGRPITEAAADLPPETVAAAQERGRGLDLWETAESILQELSPK